MQSVLIEVSTSRVWTEVRIDLDCSCGRGFDSRTAYRNNSMPQKDDEVKCGCGKKYIIHPGKNSVRFTVAD